MSPLELSTLGFAASHQFDGKMASPKAMQNGMKAFNQTTRKVARDSNTQLVDLAAAIPKSLDYMYDDVHYTEAGNQRLAETMAKHIIDSGMIPSKK